MTQFCLSIGMPNYKPGYEKLMTLKSNHYFTAAIMWLYNLFNKFPMQYYLINFCQFQNFYFVLSGSLIQQQV